MITEIVGIGDYKNIYSDIGSRKSIASILKYPEDSGKGDQPAQTIILKDTNFNGSKGVIGVIGAGNFTKMTMLPALKGSGAAYKYIASAGGVSGTALARKYGFSHSTTNYCEILNDADVDLVLITTRHNKHASMTAEAIAVGKHVFVEKPLALNNEELRKIIEIYNKFPNQSTTVTVGFNRRFSPHAIKVKSIIGNAPINVIATMNAGFIPDNVWVHDMNVGGGRIIGEACHFIDLITYFTGSMVKSVCMNAMGVNPNGNTDNASILLKYENGSTGVINYFSNGSKAYPKERVEVYSHERTAIIDNFRLTTGFGFKGFSKLKTGLDKGHEEQFRLLIERIKNSGGPLIPFCDLINTTLASFAAVESLKTNKWIEININN
jgi:predicted dehydrogenase